MDERSFVESRMAAIPEAFTDAADLNDEPLPYVALGDARMWLEDNALNIALRLM